MLSLELILNSIFDLLKNSFKICILHWNSYQILKSWTFVMTKIRVIHYLPNYHPEHLVAETQH